LTQNKLFKTLNRSDEVTIMCLSDMRYGSSMIFVWNYFGAAEMEQKQSVSKM